MREMKKMNNEHIVVKSKFNLRDRCSKKVLMFVFLLFMGTIVFSPFVSMFRCGVSFFATGAETADIVVKNEVELVNAVNAAPSDKTQYVISLSADITLKKFLEIPDGKNITLVGVGGVWKLFGPNKQSTITVAGALTLEGVCVTHAKSDTGRGVYVTESGTLTLLSGKISGNTIVESGGGVHIERGGSFVMVGGVISDNTANNVGGGVYNAGTFAMSDGVILDNRSGSSGGGVANIGIFVMSGGKISKNTAPDAGGVSNSGGYGRGVTFTMTGGEITDNTAETYCGGLFYPEGSFDWRGGTISGNKAGIDGNDASSIIISATTPVKPTIDHNWWLYLLPIGAAFVVVFVVVWFFYRSKKQKQSTVKNLVDSVVD
jgi:hypothetical protein